MRLLSETIPSIAAKAFSRKYIMLGRLVTHWPEIVGTDLAARTEPVKIRYFKKKDAHEKATASLDIAVSTSDATLLHYQKDLILERINQIFGSRWVTAIRFVPRAMNSDIRLLKKQPKPLSEGDNSYLGKVLTSIDDIDMKERLTRLGRAILQDK